MPNRFLFLQVHEDLLVTLNGDLVIHVVDSS
jgi:hypothetical protein